MADISYSLEQIVGLLTQQAQLLRNMKEQNSMLPQTVNFSSWATNPFSGASTEGATNPFSYGFANATGATGVSVGSSNGRVFGLPSASMLGAGLGLNFFERKIFNTDTSVIGTVPATSSFGFFHNKSKISQEQRMMAAANMGDKLSTGALNLGASVASMFFGTPGMIASVPLSIAADQMQRQNAYNKYLLGNSYRFINYGESTNRRGMGGFGLSDRMDAATFLRHFGTDNLISDADTQRLLKSFTEGDLLRNTKDLQSFKSNMEKLTKAVKEGAIALNESYESMAGLMSEMKKLGMDPTKVNMYAAGAKAVQGMTGLNASETLSNLLGFTGSMAQGTGMTASNLYANAQGALLYTNSMYDNLYEAAMAGDQSAQRNLNLISNLGGVESAYQAILGAEQQVLQSGAANSQFIGVLYHDWNENTHTWEFNQSKFDDMIKNAGNRNLTVEAQKEIYKHDNIAKSAWLDQGAELTMGNLDTYEMIQYLKATMDSIKQNNSVYRDKDMSTKDMLRMFFGLSGSSMELLGEFIDNGIADGGETLKRHEALAKAQERIDSANANAQGAGYKMKRFFSGIGEGIGDVFAPAAYWASAGAEKIGSWWNGYQYTLDDITSKNGTQNVQESAEYLADALKKLADDVDETGSKIKNSASYDLHGAAQVMNNIAKGGISNGSVVDTIDRASSKMSEQVQLYNLSKQAQEAIWWWEDNNIQNANADTYISTMRKYFDMPEDASEYDVRARVSKEFSKLLHGGFNGLSADEQAEKAAFMYNAFYLGGEQWLESGLRTNIYRYASDNLTDFKMQIGDEMLTMDEIMGGAYGINENNATITPKGGLTTEIERLSTSIAMNEAVIGHMIRGGKTGSNEYQQLVEQTESMKNELTTYELTKEELLKMGNLINVSSDEIAERFGLTKSQREGLTVKDRHWGLGKEYYAEDISAVIDTAAGYIGRNMALELENEDLGNKTVLAVSAATGIDPADIQAHQGDSVYLENIAKQAYMASITSLGGSNDEEKDGEIKKANEELSKSVEDTKQTIEDLDEYFKELGTSAQLLKTKLDNIC